MGTTSIPKDTLLPDNLNDDELIDAMEQFQISGAHFHHRDHVRLAWAYLRNTSLDRAEARLARCIRRFAAHYGVSYKYHHTMTVAWVRIVGAAMRLTPALLTFEQFATAHPFLFNARLPWAFYSPALLASDAARTNWVAPDLHALP
jgi:hypothetical protein